MPFLLLRAVNKAYLLYSHRSTTATTTSSCILDNWPMCMHDTKILSLHEHELAEVHDAGIRIRVFYHADARAQALVGPGVATPLAQFPS